MARVLLVDDELNIRNLIGDALVDEGYKVSLAADAAEAIALLQSSTFDVVVSDVSMPGSMSGIDLAGHIGKEYPQSGVILVSGHALAQLPEIPAETTFLPKPYRLSQLLTLLPSPGR